MKCYRYLLIGLLFSSFDTQAHQPFAYLHANPSFVAALGVLVPVSIVSLLTYVAYKLKAMMKQSKTPTAPTRKKTNLIIPDSNFDSVRIGAEDNTCPGLDFFRFSDQNEVDKNLELIAQQVIAQFKIDREQWVIVEPITNKQLSFELWAKKPTSCLTQLNQIILHSREIPTDLSISSEPLKYLAKLELHQKPRKLKGELADVVAYGKQYSSYQEGTIKKPKWLSRLDRPSEIDLLII